MACKEDLIQIFLRTGEDTDIIVVDPEREMGGLCWLLKGERIVLAANSAHHVNPMELADARQLNAEDKALALKAEFLQTMFVQLLGKEEVGARQISIIDRCLRSVYKRYRPGKTAAPTLGDFFVELKRMDTDEARRLALGLEVFIEGTLNVFAHPSNVDVTSRLVVYDINELGAGLKDVGMSIMLDAIFNRVAANRAAGRRTVIYIDEFWIMMRHPQSAEYMGAMWRRFRKYGAWVTGITQNLQDLMGCEQGRTIVKNAAISIMLGQQSGDVALLKEAYNLSDAQCLYIQDTPPGHGLLKFGDSFIPFENEFDRSLSLYRAMTTNPRERRQFDSAE